MAKSGNLRVRSFQFTVSIVRFCRNLTVDPIMRRLAFQLVDAVGSVGANLEESGGAQSKADFIAKQFIACKEAKEAQFWLRVIAASYPSLQPLTAPLLQECSEILAMLTASIRTAKSNPDRGARPPGS